MAGAAFARFHAHYAGLFAALSAAFLVLAFYLSVLRRPSTRARWTFVVMSLAVAGLSFWPSPPGLAGQLIAGFAIILAAIAISTMRRADAEGGPVAHPRLTLHVTGMT